MTFELVNKFLLSELNIESDNYIYQTNELLTALLPLLEERERFEDCAIIADILNKRGIIKNFK